MHRRQPARIFNEDPTCVSCRRMLQETRRLLDLWRSKCVGRDIPDRRDFVPEEFAPWMGFISISDVEHGPQRFRLRLVGTAIRELDDRDYTGSYLDEALEEPLRGFVVRQWASCVAKRKPVLVNYTSRSAIRASIDVEKLFLPMSVGLENVGQVLAYARTRRHGRAGLRWPTLREIERESAVSLVVVG
ncbi:MAG TPA: PAS domain-containing protein [Alphaproteobacteria bacterium]|nr:PAS domain-containing protein [Alphaproteobacteria bacterium]